MTVCKNCAKEFEGNYCPECGQKASTRRYSLKIAFSEILKKILPVDRGFLYTIKHLMTRPGSMLREYLEGKRVQYIHPFQFMLLISAISLLFFSQQDFEQGFQSGFEQTSNKAASEQFRKQIMDFFFANFSAFLLSVVPFLAAFSRLFYRKNDYNFAEHLVINCYLMAGCSIASMPTSLLFKAMGENPFSPTFTLVSTVIYLLYFAWGYVGFFQSKNRILGGLKAILTYILAYIVFIFLFGIIAGLGAVLYVSAGGTLE